MFINRFLKSTVFHLEVVLNRVCVVFENQSGTKFLYIIECCGPLLFCRV